MFTTASLRSNKSENIEGSDYYFTERVQPQTTLRSPIPDRPKEGYESDYYLTKPVDEPSSPYQNLADIRNDRFRARRLFKKDIFAEERSEKINENLNPEFMPIDIELQKEIEVLVLSPEKIKIVRDIINLLNEALKEVISHSAITDKTKHLIFDAVGIMSKNSSIVDKYLQKNNSGKNRLQRLAIAATYLKSSNNFEEKNKNILNSDNRYIGLSAHKILIQNISDAIEELKFIIYNSSDIESSAAKNKSKNIFQNKESIFAILAATFVIILIIIFIVFMILNLTSTINIFHKSENFSRLYKPPAHLTPAYF